MRCKFKPHHLDTGVVYSQPPLKVASAYFYTTGWVFSLWLLVYEYIMFLSDTNIYLRIYAFFFFTFLYKGTPL